MILSSPSKIFRATCSYKISTAFCSLELEINWLLLDKVLTKSALISGRSSHLLPLRNSSSRVSSSGKRQQPSSSHSRRTASSRSQSSAKRPTFVANTIGSGRRRKPSTKPRCAMADCKKKLTLTNTFGCRCDLSFCPQHRHPEWHNCTFDYKSEGRRLLEKANPVVTLPKLPKI